VRVRSEGTGARRGPKGEPLADRVTVTRLLDLEENVWSPQYGLKGKMDASLVATVRARLWAARPSR
jgi:hypothetical protein